MKESILQKMNACLAGMGGCLAYLLSEKITYDTEVIIAFITLAIWYIGLDIVLFKIKEEEE